MFDKVNLEKELKALKSKESRKSEATLRAFKQLFQASWEQDKEILKTLQKGAMSSEMLSPAGLDEEKIFSLYEIKSICLKYRLRFLSTKYFKQDYPQDAFRKIKETEQIAGKNIEAFVIMAPSTMFKLEDANKDPLLFTPLSDGRFYLIHKWGNDLNSFRKLISWPTKTIGNLLLTMLFASVLVAACIPTNWLLQGGDYFNFYRLGFVVFNMIFITGMSSYFWLAMNQKFSVEAWNSSTFN